MFTYLTPLFKRHFGINGQTNKGTQTGTRRDEQTNKGLDRQAKIKHTRPPLTRKGGRIII